MNSQLLSSWMKMSVQIRGNRLLRSLSLNEMLVCSSLANENEVSATQLCQQTQLLKSQMNKILTDLEERDIIQRIRSENDKRKIMISLSEYGRDVYEHEHLHVMQILSRIENQLGEDKTEMLAVLMDEAVEAIKGENK